MQFVEKGGLIFLPITLGYDGQVFKIKDCILDTGSAGTVIDIDLVPFNSKIPGDLRRLYGIGGHQDVVVQPVDFLEISNCRLKNIHIEFGDIQNNYGINGILGNDLLQFIDIEIYFRKRVIHFHENTRKNTV